MSITLTANFASITFERSGNQSSASDESTGLYEPKTVHFPVTDMTIEGWMLASKGRERGVDFGVVDSGRVLYLITGGKVAWVTDGDGKASLHFDTPSEKIVFEESAICALVSNIVATKSFLEKVPKVRGRGAFRNDRAVAIIFNESDDPKDINRSGTKFIINRSELDNIFAGTHCRWEKTKPAKSVTWGCLICKDPEQSEGICERDHCLISLFEVDNYHPDGPTVTFHRQQRTKVGNLSKNPYGDVSVKIPLGQLRLAICNLSEEEDLTELTRNFNVPELALEPSPPVSEACGDLQVYDDGWFYPRLCFAQDGKILFRIKPQPCETIIEIVCKLIELTKTYGTHDEISYGNFRVKGENDEIVFTSQEKSIIPGKQYNTYDTYILDRRQLFDALERNRRQVFDELDRLSPADDKPADQPAEVSTCCPECRATTQ